MQEKDIFGLLAQGVLESIPIDEKFQKIVLKIMRLEGVVEFSADMIDQFDNEVNLDINMGYKYAKALLTLYDLTQQNPLKHKNWNRAVFILYPDNKFDMEYIWDQELQDRVDGYNKEFDN